MIKSTTKKKVKKASSKKANPKSWIRHADLRPKGGSPDRTSSKDSEKIISNQEYYAKLHRLAEDIQWEKRNEYPIHGYPWHRALEDASEILAKKKQNPSKKCRVIKVRRKISMGKGKRPRILQVRRKVCNPSKDLETKLNKLLHTQVVLVTSDGIRKRGILTDLDGPFMSAITDFEIVSKDGKRSLFEFSLSSVNKIVGNTIYLEKYTS